jgi:hypothetical protein
MRIQTLATWALGVALALAVGAHGDQASAQVGNAPVGLDDQATKLSPGEMISRAEGDIESMKGTLGQVLEVLEKTRQEEKDLLKLNCINEKLSAIKGFLKVSEQSLTKLKTSNANGDIDSMRHQYSLVAIAGSKVENLGVEAQSCAGEVLKYAGNTKVVPEIDPDIAEIDPTAIVNEGSDIWRISEVTPYQ